MVHGLLTSSEATGSIDQQTVPIVKLVELSHYSEITIKYLCRLDPQVLPSLTINQYQAGTGKERLWSTYIGACSAQY